MISNRLRCSGACVKHRSFVSPGRDRRCRSFQLKLSAIERHHLVNIRDAELMRFSAVILPNINTVFTFLRNPCVRNIRCLADFEQRQAVGGFQVTPAGTESDANFDHWAFIFP